jgi:Fur family transcriptional regulator, peroxide stress response regulator
MNRSDHRTTTLRALEAAARRHGVPLTIQRRVILQALASRDDHPTPDQILEQVRARLPEVSRTTVYRVLDTLVNLGLAVKICSPGTSARFDSKTHRHHHLVCLQCEKVIDFEAPALNSLPLPDAKAHAFDIHDYSVHFRGLCAACKRQRVDPSQKRQRRPPAKIKGKTR